MNRSTSTYDLAGQTVALVAEAYDIPLASLIAPGRDPLLVEARRVAMQLLAERGLGASSIGRALGRDHSTVLHHLALLRARRTPEEQEMLTDLRTTLTRTALWPPLPER